MALWSLISCDHARCRAQWATFSGPHLPDDIRADAAQDGWSFSTITHPGRADLCPKCTRRAQRQRTGHARRAHNKA